MRPVFELFLLAFAIFCLFGCTENDRSVAQDSSTIDPSANTFEDIDQLISSNQTGEDCEDPLEVWRTKYTVRDDVVPYGIYRQIYTNRRVSINKKGAICECSLDYNSTQVVQRKSGALKGSNVLVWSKVWSDTNSFPNPTKQDYLVTIWNEQGLIKPLWVQERVGTGCFMALQLLSETEMTEKEICKCKAKK